MHSMGHMQHTPSAQLLHLLVKHAHPGPRNRRMKREKASLLHCTCFACWPTFRTHQSSSLLIEPKSFNSPILTCFTSWVADMPSQGTLENAKLHVTSTERFLPKPKLACFTSWLADTPSEGTLENAFSAAATSAP